MLSKSALESQSHPHSHKFASKVMRTVNRDKKGDTKKRRNYFFLLKTNNNQQKEPRAQK